MADISSYIEKIQNAIYGEEVRGSIMNALEKVNDDNEKYLDIKKDVVASAGIVEDKADQFNKDFAQAKTTIEQLKSSTSTANTAKSNLDAITKTANTAATDLQNKTKAATTTADRADIINTVLLESTQEAIEACTQLEGNLINVLSTEQVENIAIKEEVTGEVISLQDSADWRVKGMTLYGKSEQVKTTGVQLLDVNKVTLTSGVTIDGTKVTVAGKGLCYDIFTGIAGVEHIIYNAERNPYLVAGTYTFSANVNADYHLFAITENHEFNYKSRGRTIPLTFTITESCYISIGPSGSTVTSGVTFTISDMVLAVNGNDLNWEPYTGGKPSPSPEYPQEIASIGDNGALGVNVCGKNLLDLRGWVKNIKKKEPNFSAFREVKYMGQDCMYMDVSASANRKRRYKMPFIKGKRYKITISGYTASSTINAETNALYIILIFKDGSKLEKRLFTNGVSKETKQQFVIITPVEKEIESIGFSYGSTSAGYLVLDECSIVEYDGNNSAEPMPYIGQSLTLPLLEPLRGIPVSSGGNYTDANGQEWICDTVEYKDGVAKIVRRIFYYSATGDEKNIDLSVSYPGAINLTQNVVTQNGNTYKLKDNIMCNILPHGKAKFGYCRVSEFSAMFWIKDGAFNNKEEASAFLKSYADEGRPLTFIAEINEIVEEPLTPEQFAALKTYYQYTTFYNDANADMSVTYVADPQIYMDNKFKEIQNAIVSLGGNI